MAGTMSPSQALLAYLASIPDYLRPSIYDDLVHAAGQIRNATDAAVIFTLLGRASSYGSDVPSGPLKFPYDHQLHLNMGTEWYWLSCNLAVVGSLGLDRIGVMIVINRSRAVSNIVQASAGWSDVDAQVVSTAATVTVATREDCFIVRRSPNVQWPAMGGDVAFASDPFLYQNGPDSLQGSENVLPLVVHVGDEPNMTVDLTMTSALPVGSAFFLQGIQGITPEPRPGLYYSWPQLSVQGSVSVGGKTYAVQGTGWIDHQLMMDDTAALAPLAPPPSPGYVPIPACNGWSWCQFNLSNGDAFTVAAFQIGTLRDDLLVPYGFYVARDGDQWSPIPLIGSLNLDRFIPGLEGVLIPSAWRYEVTDWKGGRLVDIGLMPVPWYPDGSFATGNLAILGETPVEVALVNYAPVNAQTGSGQALTGSGYCESVGYEPVENYAERCLAYLNGS